MQEITRQPRITKPLAVPRAVEKELPYKYRSQLSKKYNIKDKIIQRRKKSLPFSNQISKVVVRDEHESQVFYLLFIL